MSRITFHVTGTLAPGGSISMRTLGYLCMNFQSAINRAYLEGKHGTVKKFQKIKNDDYEETDFFFTKTKKGSIIIDFIEKTQRALAISEKLQIVLDVAYDTVTQGFEKEYFDDKKHLGEIKDRISSGTLKARSFEYLKKEKHVGLSSSYASKAIVKYIATALTPLRKARDVDDKITVEIETEKTNKYTFDRKKASHLYRLSTSIAYLYPVTYKAKVFEMNAEKKSAEIYNLQNNFLKQRVFFRDDFSFSQVQQIFTEDKDFDFIGVPRVEYGSLDVDRGDIVFIEVLD